MIQISNLSKTYRTGFFMKARKALDSINLQVNEGDIYGFIGSNGAGKSTTIKILLGLLRYSEGEVRLFGDLKPSLEARRQMGYLPEHPYFYEHLSGREILNYYGQLVGLKGPQLKQAIDEALAKVHADKDWIDTRLRRYSKGMVQRVGLAQAILHKPKLLILDEPMSGLDPMGRKDVREAILDLNRSGTTIFYSSHVLGDVEKISNRVGMIVKGKISMEGDVPTLLKNHGNLEDLLSKEIALHG